MSTVEILVIALLVFSAFCALVEAVQKVLVARAKRPACPCRDLHSLTLTPGAVFELPPGTTIPPAAAPGTFDVTHVEYGVAIEGGWEETGRKWVTTYQYAQGADEVVNIRTAFSADGVEDVARAFKRAAGEVH